MTKIKIYTKTLCPFCIKAKLILKSLGKEFEEITLKTDEEILELSSKTGMMTVPQIFINDKLIGGCDDLEKLKKENKLKDLL